MKSKEMFSLKTQEVQENTEQLLALGLPLSIELTTLNHPSPYFYNGISKISGTQSYYLFFPGIRMVLDVEKIEFMKVINGNHRLKIKQINKYT